MTLTRYDLMVIGAGAAGSSAANEAAAHGMRVGLIERDKLGGTYLNYGCDPTKALLHIASIRHQALQADKYGIHIPSADVDWPGIKRYVQGVIEQVRGGTPAQAREKLRQRGIEVIEGEAEFISEHEMGIGGRLYEAARIIITSGSHTITPPIQGLDHTGFLTNIDVMKLPQLPHTLAVIGGGPLGVEFAQMFRRFDVEVTLLESKPTLLEHEDSELVKLLEQVLRREGIQIETGVTLQQAKQTPQGKRLHYQDASRRQRELNVADILLATGRESNLAPLHLEAADVRSDNNRILVDATLRTSVPHIWAAGDVIGGMRFTHVASAQGKAAARNALAHHPQSFNIQAVPWCIFTDPPLAHVGSTEEQLRASGIPYRVGRTSFKENTRAIVNGRTTGLIKLLIDEQNQVLGAHILGDRADDLITPIVLAMRNNLGIEQLASTTIQYPTLSESVRWASVRTTPGRG